MNSKHELSLKKKNEHFQTTLEKMAAPVWFFFWLALLGVFHVSKVSMGLLVHLALRLRQSYDFRRRFGSWAVVTGPTSGIGLSMSLELARHGLNLVLVGRDPVKPRYISKKISRTHGVQTVTVLFDFSLVSTPQGEEAMRRLREAVEGLDVCVLVNNAGVAKPGAVYLHEVNMDAWARMIRVNVMALTEVTATVLPGMVERGRGAVVIIGVGSPVVPALLRDQTVRRPLLPEPLGGVRDERNPRPMSGPVPG